MPFEKAVREIEKNSVIIKNPGLDGLAKLSQKEGRKTSFGSMCFVSRVRGRSAKETEIIFGKPDAEQEKLLWMVAGYLKGKRLFQVERNIATTKPFRCRAYISADYPHIPYLWANTLFDSDGKKPDIITVQVPEWPEVKVLIDPRSGINFILGSDYVGELKMANLRLAMYRTKENGGLGLHAGSKMLRVRDSGGRLVEKGVLLFGLSATGKTTLTCHDHWLDGKKGEGIAIRQDDIVLMQKDSFCAGTEKNFYVKTDGLDLEGEPIVYKAAISRHALFENVMVKENGEVDFFDTSLTSNGRAVVPRNGMDYSDGSVDIESADIVLFITRRNTIVPPVARLDKEFSAAFFMLGESMGSSASDDSPGKPRRVVGMNPFIVGPKGEEGNRFYELLKKNPHVECYLLNTGMIGEGGDGPGEKITVHDSATIIREIARGTVEWKKDPDWGYEILDRCPGVEVSRFHPERHYPKERYSELTEELRKERREWLAGFPKLHKKIKDAV